MSCTQFQTGTTDEGRAFRFDINDSPHILVCGATGTGKSNFVHGALTELISHNSPDDLRLLLFDSKIVELAQYNGIPHLLVPWITDASKLEGALAWLDLETKKRLRLFADSQIRTLQGYNDHLWESFLDDNGLPHILVVIDDLSSAITQRPQIADYVREILLNGRTVGIHLMAVTQTPLWKGTKPISLLFRTKVVFSAATAQESKTLLGVQGAERLGACGQSLVSVNGKTVKVQMPLITDAACSNALSTAKSFGDVSFIDTSLDTALNPSVAPEGDGEDELLPAAVEVILETGLASVSMLQRRLKLGYGRAARLVDQMEEKGIVGPFEGSKPRQIIITRAQWCQMQGIDVECKADEKTETNQAAPVVPWEDAITPSCVEPEAAAEPPFIADPPARGSTICDRNAPVATSFPKSSPQATVYQNQRRTPLLSAVSDAISGLFKTRK